MSSVFNTDRKIRLGIWGLGRGSAFIEQCRDLNINVVAGCDTNGMLRDEFRKLCPDAFITDDEDTFLAYDLDAVLVATFFMSHAKHAIKALKAGKHVMSEVTAFFTPAEGVELVEAVEQSGKVYCMAEDFTNVFVKKLWQEGVFGELAYAEVDYVHETRALSYSYLTGDPIQPGNTAHAWRSWLNSHYYCTHSLGQVMETTGNRPVRVIAPPVDKIMPGLLPGSESRFMAPSFVTMDNGAIVRNLMGTSTGDSHARRFWGTRAFVDMTGKEPVVRLGQFGHGECLTLTPPQDDLTALAAKAGHNGGDFWVLYHFANAILNGIPHPWDIYASCDVTLTGIMAVKSQLNGGIPVDVPDFRDKATRERYRHDTFEQPHFDPQKIFPEDQNFAETKNFTSIMNELDLYRDCKGVPLINSAVDIMKLYPYIKESTSRNVAQYAIRNLIRDMPGLIETFRSARTLAEKYPDSLGGQALQSFLDAACPEKMANPQAFLAELRNWLINADMRPYRQLRMDATPELIQAAKTPALPDGFILRTFKDGDEEAYLQLMQSAGFSGWNMATVTRVKENALENGIFFIEDKSTGRLAATAMANKLKPERDPVAYELGWVGANPDYRGLHLAAIVCTAVLEHFHAYGVTHAFLTTDDFRVPAIKTYLKLGWLPNVFDEEMSKRWNILAKKIGITLNTAVTPA